MLKNIGLPEVVIILIILLIFFGPAYLKNLAKQLGLAGKELKNIDKEYKETVHEISKEVVKKEEVKNDDVKQVKKITNEKKQGGDI